MVPKRGQTAPHITKQQVKKTLSGKKNKKETIKNVLVKPTSEYWPELSEEHANRLKAELEVHLPRLKCKSMKIPYVKIKDIPKTERKAFRRGLQPNIVIPIAENVTNLVFGVNDTSKAIESDACSCILLEKEVSPRVLVQHVIDLAVLYNIPILVVPNLRQILHEYVGIKSVAFAIKNGLSSANPINNVLTIVRELSIHYPLSKHHINFDRRHKLTNSKLDTPVIDLITPEKRQQPQESVERSCHLIRQNVHERVFMPEQTKKKTVPQESSDFIPLAPTEEISIERPDPKPTKSPRYYKSLLVKRLKGDKNRNTRKLGNIKTKTK